MIADTNTQLSFLVFFIVCKYLQQFLIAFLSAIWLAKHLSILINQLLIYGDEKNQHLCPIYFIHFYFFHMVVVVYITLLLVFACLQPSQQEFTITSTLYLQQFLVFSSVKSYQCIVFNHQQQQHITCYLFLRIWLVAHGFSLTNEPKCFSKHI